MSESHRAEHLIFQTAFLGDLLLSIPLLRELRRIAPQDKLTLVCRKGLGDLISECELVDEVIEVDKSSAASWRAARASLSRRRFDLILCPHESFRSALFVGRLKANLKIGFKRFFNHLFFQHRVERPMRLPEALRQLALLTPIERKWSESLVGFERDQGAGSGGQSADGELMTVPEWADMQVPRLVKWREQFRASRTLPVGAVQKLQVIASRLNLGEKKIAILAPGSVWPTKMWTEQGFAEVARSLTASGYQVLLLGSPDEAEICARVADLAPGASSIAGQTSLFESALVLAMAEILIGNDSGAMHLAAAAGVPSVSVFGPTILEFGYRPWQNHAAVVQVPRSEMACRPCGKHGARECPLGTHACMKQVSSAQVLEKIKHVLL